MASPWSQYLNSPPDQSADDMADHFLPVMGKGIADHVAENYRHSNELSNRAWHGDLSAASELADQSAGMAMGSITPEGPWSELQKVSEGQNPLMLSKREWGQWISGLGNDIRNKTGELIGSQLMDEIGSTNPQELIHGRMIKEGIPEYKLPSVMVRPIEQGWSGIYRPKLNGISLNSAEIGAPVQHPEAYFNGIAGHEAQHAIDYFRNPDLTNNPEMMDPDVMSNSGLGSSGLFQPRRISKVYSEAINDPALMGRLPDYIQELLRSGESPNSLALSSSSRPDVQSSIGGIYRTAVGNKGFNGNNQYLADTMRSAGHFAAPIQSEMDIPAYYLAKQEAALGNQDIHPDWQFPAVKQAMSEYQSPQVQSLGIPAQKAANPWAIPLGIGAAAAPYMKGDQPKEPTTNQKSYDENNQIVEPGATPSPSPNGTFNTPDMDKILGWLHAQGY